jgi:nickel-dependent lactate racemase
MSVMRIDLAFGKTGLAVTLPDRFNYRVLEARSAQPLPDWQSALEAALDHPTGTLPLAELARGKRSAAISVCDITRPAPKRKTLPPVLRRLEQSCIPRDGVTILIATGLHRPATPKRSRDLRRGDRRRVPRGAHDAVISPSHRPLGATASGTPVFIDERFIAADLHITLGFIEPHLMLGYSGGRKLIAPGLAAQETIKVLHSPKFMRDPRAVEGSIEDNPLHRELLEISRMAATISSSMSRWPATGPSPASSPGIPSRPTAPAWSSSAASCWRLSTIRPTPSSPHRPATRSISPTTRRSKA